MFDNYDVDKYNLKPAFLKSAGITGSRAVEHIITRDTMSQLKTL